MRADQITRGHGWRRRAAVGLAVCGLAATAVMGAGCRLSSADGEAGSALVVVQPGGRAPDFGLRDLRGEEHVLSDYTAAGRVVVLEWFNPDCPFVQMQYEGELKRIPSLQADYTREEVVWLRINSGGEGQQGSGVARNALAKSEWQLEGPILLDESGEVGRAYGAKTTPHMFVIDAGGTLVYAGAIDDAKGGAASVSDRVYVREAIEAVLAGTPVPLAETQPYGCGVKYGR